LLRDILYRGPVPAAHPVGVPPATTPHIGGTSHHFAVIALISVLGGLFPVIVFAVVVGRRAIAQS
jgi:hypothetical protein